MQFLTILKTIIALLPIIIDAVKVIEAAFPQGGQGAAKLEAVRATVASAYESATDVSGSFSAIWPAIQSAVSAIVGIANSAGVFKK